MSGFIVTRTPHPAIAARASARRFRWGVVNTRSKVFPDGKRRYAVGFGVKLGYWPCLRTPYLQLALFHKRASVWYGPELGDKL